jgi:hypothetical protein
MQDLKNKENRREFPRFEIPIQLRPTEVFGKEGRVQNISMGGVMIFGTKKVEVGTTLKIDFALSTGEWVMAEVQVVWAKEQPSQPILKYDFGCRFIEIPPESQQILLEHLASISSLKIKI